jgi:exopolysaccharide biosynthesis protein
MRDFADNMIEFGCQKAYALDGDQTGTIVTNDKLINRPDYGTQRTVSDMIYFATAVPDGG